MSQAVREKRIGPGPQPGHKSDAPCQTPPVSPVLSLWYCNVLKYTQKGESSPALYQRQQSMLVELDRSDHTAPHLTERRRPTWRRNSPPTLHWRQHSMLVEVYRSDQTAPYLTGRRCPTAAGATLDAVHPTRVASVGTPRGSVLTHV